MRKLFYAAFFLAVVLGLGCAISNYDLITDNDQVANGQGSGVVNTNGKAKIHRWFQIAWNHPDGSDEMFSMVDQKANGDRTITTYNNFTTGDGPELLDDMYCNPDWSGCAIWTAPDPEEGDLDPFDGDFNANCSGARSLLLLMSTGRYYGECGRAAMSVSDRIALMNMGQIQVQNGIEGLLYNLNRNNVKIEVSNDSGVTSQIPWVGTAGMFVDVQHRQVVIDATDSLLSNSLRFFADWVQDYASQSNTITLTLNGISKSWTIGGLDSAKIRRYANRKY